MIYQVRRCLLAGVRVLVWRLAFTGNGHLQARLYPE